MYNQDQKLTTDSDDIYFSFSTKNTFNSFHTISIGNSGTNFPDWIANLLAISKFNGYFIMFQIFFNSQILIAFVMTHLYFYCEKQYRVSFDQIKESPGLFFILGQEYYNYQNNFNGEFINDRIVNYIVDKFCDNNDHVFHHDDDYKVLKEHIESKLNSKAKDVKKRISFYKDNFNGLRKFYHNKIWIIIYISVDIMECIALIMYTDNVLTRIAPLSAELQKLDPTKDAARISQINVK